MYMILLLGLDVAFWVLMKSTVIGVDSTGLFA